MIQLYRISFFAILTTSDGIIKMNWLYKHHQLLPSVVVLFFEAGNDWVQVRLSCPILTSPVLPYPLPTFPTLSYPMCNHSPSHQFSFSMYMHAGQGEWNKKESVIVSTYNRIKQVVGGRDTKVSTSLFSLLFSHFSLLSFVISHHT